jgi:hypothetical protein
MESTERIERGGNLASIKTIITGETQSAHRKNKRKGYDLLCGPIMRICLVFRRDVAVGEFGAFAEEIVFHLFFHDLLGLRV